MTIVKSTWDSTTEVCTTSPEPQENRTTHQCPQHWCSHRGTAPTPIQTGTGCEICAKSSCSWGGKGQSAIQDVLFFLVNTFLAKNFDVLSLSQNPGHVTGFQRWPKQPTAKNLPQDWRYILEWLQCDWCSGAATDYQFLPNLSGKAPHRSW